MRQIRPAQMQAFSSAAEVDFERRAMEYLARTYPDYAQRHGETELRMLLKECLAQADSTDLGSEKGIITWAELVICYGAGFQKREPWARYIIAANLDRPTRVERLREYV